MWIITVNHFEDGDRDFPDVLYFESRPQNILYLETLTEDFNIELDSEDSIRMRPVPPKETE